MTYLLLFSCLLISSTVALSPFDGFNSIKQINVEMENHFARENSLSVEAFNARLPSQLEMSSIRKLISLLYIQKDLKVCAQSTINDLYPIFNGTLMLSTFQNTYCILHEPLPSGPKVLFPRTFGYAVVRLPTSDSINVHHSAAHFESDGGVTAQAATLFETTKSRTLINNGMSRFSVIGRPDSTCQPGNTQADAAHNINMVFHALLLGVFDSTKSTNGSSYIQWHGMAQTTCLQSDAFVSLGANSKNAIYQSDNVADRLAKAITQSSNGKIVGNTPGVDTVCSLVAATNVFGRAVHGVEESQVCATAAKAVDQRFIHIEQKMAARTAFDAWTSALNTVFRPATKRLHDELRV